MPPKKSSRYPKRNLPVQKPPANKRGASAGSSTASTAKTTAAARKRAAVAAAAAAQATATTSAAATNSESNRAAATVSTPVGTVMPESEDQGQLQQGLDLPQVDATGGSAMGPPMVAAVNGGSTGDPTVPPESGSMTPPAVVTGQPQVSSTRVPHSSGARTRASAHTPAAAVPSLLYRFPLMKASIMRCAFPSLPLSPPVSPGSFVHTRRSVFARIVLSYFPQTVKTCSIFPPMSSDVTTSSQLTTMSSSTVSSRAELFSTCSPFSPTSITPPLYSDAFSTAE
eukprot:GHVU01040075.1.p1 GENE.GHVU01040075.1~~GHVU01040075.1.p1  ORF type:complete len:283 (+),score=20.09 GHVU01040075.1:946-1794(+)